MSRVVMFVFNDCTTDARVLREAGSLAAAGHEVTIMARPRDLATSREEVEARDSFTIRRVPLPRAGRLAWRASNGSRRSRVLTDTVTTVGMRPPLGALRRALRSAVGTSRYLGRWALTLAWARAAASRAPAADFYHAHDLTALPAAVRASRRSARPVIYDSHEIFIESDVQEGRPRVVRSWLGGLERSWSGHASALVTVNRSVAEELERRLHPRRVVIVHNCAPRWEPPDPRPDLLRAAAGIPADAAIALYHGGLKPHRGIEQLVQALLEPGMGRVHGVLMGYGPDRPAYEALARQGRFDGRLHVLAAVPPADLIPWVASADVGVMAIQRSTLNHWLATPNKLFECLAAGVPVVASDFPEMHRIVADDPGGPLGLLGDPDDIPALALAILTIVKAPAAERAELRRRCLRAAHARWNWETESRRLLDLYEDLASDGGAGPA